MKKVRKNSIDVTFWTKWILNSLSFVIFHFSGKHVEIKRCPALNFSCDDPLISILAGIRSKENSIMAYLELKKNVTRINFCLVHFRLNKESYSGQKRAKNGNDDRGCCHSPSSLSSFLPSLLDRQRTQHIRLTDINKMDTC